MPCNNPATTLSRSRNITLSGDKDFFNRGQMLIAVVPHIMTFAWIIWFADIFYAGLRMIQATLESNVQLFDVLRPPLPEVCNYKISLMNQSKERVTSDGHQPRDTNIRVCRTEASFQSVVETFANQNNITFYPKTGSNSMIDGKPVYLFGNHQVYVDKNVLYTLRESKWQPIALEQLLSCS
jgi:hypothetical protein